MNAVKEAARKTVDRHAEQLIGLSERLHADPETAWEEHRAAAAVPELLDRAGFDVTSSYLGLDTALPSSATGPSGSRCAPSTTPCPASVTRAGTTSSRRAPSAPRWVWPPSPTTPGLTVEVYGTPAEEGGGGKIEMLDRGAFAGVDLAMMVHPAPVDVAEARRGPLCPCTTGRT